MKQITQFFGRRESGKQPQERKKRKTNHGLLKV